MKYYIIKEEEVKENGCDCGEPYCTLLSKAKLVDLDAFLSPLKGREQNNADYQFTNGWNAGIRNLTEYTEAQHE